MFFLEITCNRDNKRIILGATVQLDKIMQIWTKIRLRLGKFFADLGKLRE